MDLLVDYSSAEVRTDANFYFESSFGTGRRFYFHTIQLIPYPRLRREVQRVVEDDRKPGMEIHHSESAINLFLNYMFNTDHFLDHSERLDVSIHEELVELDDRYGNGGLTEWVDLWTSESTNIDDMLRLTVHGGMTETRKAAAVHPEYLSRLEMTPWDANVLSALPYYVYRHSDLERVLDVLDTVHDGISPRNFATLANVVFCQENAKSLNDANVGRVTKLILKFAKNDDDMTRLLRGFFA